MDDKPMTLMELSQKARELSNVLFRRGVVVLECSRWSEKDPRSCLQVEAERPLTAEEVRYGWTRRPFWAYDNERLCNACRAYWFAERLAQTLHEMHCFQVKYSGK